MATSTRLGGRAHQSSWRIGAYRGVAIRLHLSLLLILPYLVFITTARFEALTRSAGVLASDLKLPPLAWGVVMAALLFSSVLIHELGHVAVALRQGAKVKSITLMMLGGVSDMEEIPQKGAQEFRLAIIGPVISLALSGLGFALARIPPIPGAADFFVVSLWFGQVNLALALFNLLPAFPLDGGRVLRSLLSIRFGALKATRLAVRVGTAFAWTFGIFGLLSFNILLMLIGFFLYAAAQAELAMIVAKRLLHGLCVGDVATLSEALAPETTVAEAALRMLRTRQTLVPVIGRDGKGSLISLQQLRSIPESKRGQVPLGDLVEWSLQPLNAEESLEEALPELASAPFAALPVNESGKTVGFIRHSDLHDVLQLRSLEEEKSEAA
ncbi:MAG: hypothetical protein RJB38_1244 [Pseudomonadota bacterium]|jgi:Zn-dependent protease/CBS domain-containing protein